MVGFSEPLASWCRAHARTRRTKLDWAREVAHLLGGRFAGLEGVILVIANLKPTSKGVLYEAFEPERPRWLAEPIKFAQLVTAFQHAPGRDSWRASPFRRTVRHRREAALGLSR